MILIMYAYPLLLDLFCKIKPIPDNIDVIAPIIAAIPISPYITEPNINPITPTTNNKIAITNTTTTPLYLLFET